MISDTLFEARTDIRRYLDDPATARCYTGRTRERILRLLAQMRAVQRDLDRTPMVQERIEDAALRQLQRQTRQSGNNKS